ncbi:hypothetical protein FD687_01235 [Apilactobacillus kunkeei]|nr:hypothetical protein FD687_01235 [Apilactobacillus kunkeei]TMT04221.1 hypothetical protein FD689_01370 [Apilactobacillus kunkeei]
MLKKIKINNFFKNNIFIVFSFFVTSILSGIFMYHSHFVSVNFDLFFHYQRIAEIKSSIINGSFPSIVSFNAFNNSGSAVMSMYPQYNLLPIVLLSFFIKSSVDLFHIVFITTIFIGLIISYFSSYSYNSSKKISFIFSLAYIINARALCYYYGLAYSIGTISSIIILPLVFFGLLNFLEKNKWVELSIGVSLLLLSHVLSFGIVLSFIFILLVLNISKFYNNRNKILSLIKSILTSILLTSIFWIPFINISFNNKLFIPEVSTLSGDSFQNVFAVFDNNVNTSITLISFIGIILCVIKYKFLSTTLKQLFWISVMFLIMSSDLFPWNILSKTFLIHLQFPYRLNIIPQIILCYLFSVIFIRYINGFKKSTLMIVLLSISIIFLQMDAQKSLVNKYSSNPELQTHYVSSLNTLLRNNNDFKKMLEDSSVTTDYYPKKSMNISYNIGNHIATYDNKKIKINHKKNGTFTFQNDTNIKKLSLPIIYYKGLSYQVFLDGKKTSISHDINDLMTISNISKGSHKIKIKTNRSILNIFSYLLSLTGLLIITFCISKNLKEKSN